MVDPPTVSWRSMPMGIYQVIQVPCVYSVVTIITLSSVNRNIVLRLQGTCEWKTRSFGNIIRVKQQKRKDISCHWLLMCMSYVISSWMLYKLAPLLTASRTLLYSVTVQCLHYYSVCYLKGRCCCFIAVSQSSDWIHQWYYILTFKVIS